MCGIFFHVSAHAHDELNSQDEARLRARGPDAFHTHTTIIGTESRQWHLTFSSSVLALRGDQVVPQPIVDDLTGSVFCWNGEAWSYDAASITGNDTKVISNHLFNAVRQDSNAELTILDILSKITGPYAFVFYDAKSSSVYFGRDNLGRRSLLIHQDDVEGTRLTLCSIPVSATNPAAREVNTLFVHKIDLSQPELSIVSVPSRTPVPSINEALPFDYNPPELLPSQTAITDLLDELNASLRPRVKGIPTYTSHGSGDNPIKVAVLFSGGLDCTLLARLVHDILPHDQSIDLLNVAFENLRVLDSRSPKQKQEYDYNWSPDRVTGLKSHAELTKVCHERTWRFVAINIPYDEFLTHRPTIIELMSPHNTEMDLSIAAALYFAARGKGTIVDSTPTDLSNTNTPTLASPTPYTTSSRILLSGLGADELFAGYSRHAASFARAGYKALTDELSLDFTRIGTRNLGRDDRVMAHWARETRFPFLDERFVEFALGLPVWEKCGFRVGVPVPKHFEDIAGDGEEVVSMEGLHPEKMLLRCAAWQSGMTGVAREKKRAIQFGARSAKMTNGKSKGDDLVS